MLAGAATENLGVPARRGLAPAGAPETIPALDASGAAGVSLVPDNRAAFALRARSARAAAETLDLQYYTWNEDVTGALLAREVLGAADR
ncbi:MAG: phospholipase D family protein, partial [Acetobacteraceae bacterium]|nr:phospholipase D family protein [Acetobacteraceae bacterium]